MFLALLLLATGGSLPLHARHMKPMPGADPLTTARHNYQVALEALEQRRWDEYLKLRPGLDDYPLAVYLDYYELSRQMHRLSAREAREFLGRIESTPLNNRFLSSYLHQAGKRRQWRSFLALMPDEPNDVVLKCYYYRARLAEGEPEKAWAGAQMLWVHGRSRPDECDPLFEAWLAAGKLTDELVWQRMLAAFDERQRKLMRYVARKGSDKLKPWSSLLQQIYRRPQDVAKVSLPGTDARSVDIATYGVSSLARYSPPKALAAWQQLQQRLRFSEQQVRRVESEIALRSLFARTEAHRDWLHVALGRLADDKLTGIRLRWALRERDWDALEKTLPLLSPEEREESVWRYWQAVALEQRGAVEQAGILLQQLATERGYYSFLAADRLGKSYQFNARPLAEAPAPMVTSHPALKRIEELHFHDSHTLAHSEWYKVLQDAGDESAHAQLAQLAYERGWYRMAIDAASRARAWDALDVRFPLAYQKVFEFHATEQNVPSSELLAISRRESAFFPQARSPVGARGLMQIMPATGKQVARRMKTRHSSADLYKIDHNVMLGSAYYRELLDRFNGNRIFALSAYNAGPHRVDRWRNGDQAQAVPVDVWVETIPFKETRNYVQAVLAYNLVFQYLMGEDRLALLTEAEQIARY